MSATASLLEVFSRLDDPRKAHGVRHPFSSIVSLTVLGMLARIREMEVLVRWGQQFTGILCVSHSVSIVMNLLARR